MRRTELCLLPAVLVCLGASSIGCDGPVSPGGSNEVIYFGRVAESYEVCFHVGDDLATLTPSVDCDGEGETAYSFNIEVEAGSDQDGNVCSFEFPYQQTIPIIQDPTTGLLTFEVDRIEIPGENAVISFGGTIQGGSANGFATRATLGGSCEILWMANTGPICREEAQAVCDLLFVCCESIFLVPPSLGSCLDVVNECDAVACESVLAGYAQCQQPPFCPVDEDPDGDCALLNDCCNTIDLSQEDLEACLVTAAACDETNCVSLLAEYPECPQPVCPVDEDPNGDCALLNDCCNTIDLSQEDLEACLVTAAACDPVNCRNLLAEYPECPQPVTEDSDPSSVPPQ